MAELLIMLVGNTNADSVKDQRGSYKRGDAVVVFPDGHEWGAAEGPPKFGVLKIPDLTVEQAKKYLQPETFVIEEFVFPDGTSGPMTFIRTRRLYQVDIDAFTKKQRTDLEEGRLEINFSQAKSRLKNKATGNTE